MKLQVVQGDLLDQDVDVIVNAWNRNVIPWWLLLPQGVSGAIKKRGGTGPFTELRKHGSIPLGGAVLTSAGRLPFKGIIHVAGINLLWRASVGHVDEDNEIRVDAISPHHAFFVEQIKRHRAARRLDRIVCFNDKCVYECVWGKADGGQPICIFALNIYDWSALANTEDFPRRGCVGVYLAANGRPAGATTATRLTIPISNFEKLDPFGR